MLCKNYMRICLHEKKEKRRCLKQSIDWNTETHQVHFSVLNFWHVKGLLCLVHYNCSLSCPKRFDVQKQLFGFLEKGLCQLLLLVDKDTVCIRSLLGKAPGKSMQPFELLSEQDLRCFPGGFCWLVCLFVCFHPPPLCFCVCVCFFFVCFYYCYCPPATHNSSTGFRGSVCVCCELFAMWFLQSLVQVLVLYLSIYSQRASAFFVLYFAKVWQ